MVKFLNLKTAFIFILTPIVLLGAAQLVLVNESSTGGGKIRDLEEQKFRLENEISVLQKEVAGLGSLARIQEEAGKLGLMYNSQAFEYLSSPKLAQAQ